MNKVRRQRLRALGARIEKLIVELDELYDEEAECWDSMPENFRGSERYEAAADACSCLEYASAYLSDAMDQVIAAMGN